MAEPFIYDDPGLAQFTAHLAPDGEHTIIRVIGKEASLDEATLGRFIMAVLSNAFFTLEQKSIIKKQLGL